MKKQMIVLAALGAVVGAVQAQSSVTVYGVVDAGVRHLTNADAAGDSKLTMGSKGTYSSNRFGFSGVEDLGDGMNAHFNLEGGFNSGTGALDNTANVLFRRQAFAGLGGKWGSVDFGRQYTVAFKVAYAYDPFDYKYTDLIPVAGAATGARFDNDIQYTGAFGPVTLRAEYALGEVAGSTRNGSAQAVGMSYIQGPLILGAAYTQRKPAPTFLDNKNWTVGGGYRIGDVGIYLGYIDEKQATATIDTTTKNEWGGVRYKLTTAMELTAAYYRTKTSTAGVAGKRDLAMLGGAYSLSKSTRLYADIDNARLSGTTSTAAAGQTLMTGISAGVFHAF